MTEHAFAEGPVLVDAHVHVHAAFDVPRFLEAAERNLVAGARAQGLDDARMTGVLLLTAGRGEGAFERLRHACAVSDTWRATVHGKGESLLLRSVRGRTLVAIAGHQIVTAERLEVLALCCAAEIADGGSLEQTIAAVRAQGGIPLLPWGFGKWTFGRGARIAQVMATASRPLLLGDNGGRPALSWTPRHLRSGVARGIPVLPGSDPLPFADQALRVGRVGVVMEAPLDLADPAASVRHWLESLEAQPRRFGAGIGFADFVRDQVRMQLRMRRATARAVT
jgi:hypothetical protein